jgi:hypothetical protein
MAINAVGNGLVTELRQRWDGRGDSHGSPAAPQRVVSRSIPAAAWSVHRGGARSDALLWKARVAFLWIRLKQGLLEVPPGCTIVPFARYDGKPPADLSTVPRNDTTFGERRGLYVKTFSNGAIETNAFYTAKAHLSRLEKTIGKRFLLASLCQCSIDWRCRDRK